MFSKYVDSVFDFGFKNSNERNSKITKITPHHMAGIMSGISCARMHYNSDVSANYYIGVQGEIVGGVAEERRAWTSNSRENDHSAITIEVSNEVLNGEWKISDTVYKSLVKLCADICERYNIIPKYNGNDSGSITVHRMFCNTECPGGYLMNIIESGKFEKDILEAMGKAEEPVEPVEPVTDFDYVISQGDTLTSISKRFNTTVKFLKDLNKIENADKINSGDIIQTGFLYEVEKGDTLTSISKKFGTTIKRLTVNNTLENPDKIFIGQWLVIR